MSRHAGESAHEPPAGVQSAGRAGARRRSAASSVRPHVYYRPTPHGGRVTIVSGEALPAVDRANIAEAADGAERLGGPAEGDRLHVDVSPSLDADAVYVEDAGVPPVLLLRAYQSPERAVMAVMYCLPGLSPQEVRRLVDMHFQRSDDATGHPAAAELASGTTRTGRGRGRMMVLGALAVAGAVVVGVTANSPDGPFTAPSVTAGRSDTTSADRSQSRADAQPLTSPTSETMESESVVVETTTSPDDEVEETASDEPEPEQTSSDDDAAADTSTDSNSTTSSESTSDESTTSSDPTTTSDPTTSSEPTTSRESTKSGESTSSDDPTTSSEPTEPSNSESDTDDSDGFSGLFDALFG